MYVTRGAFQKAGGARPQSRPAATASPAHNAVAATHDQKTQPEIRMYLPLAGALTPH